MLNTKEQYRTTPRQFVGYTKTVLRTTVASAWYSLFDLASNPGVMAIGNTTNGIVPVPGNAGYPPLNAFGSGSGEIGSVEFGSSVACRIRLFDAVFAVGALPFNANGSLSAQPSFSTRIPNGGAGETEIWCEQVTAATGNQAVTVTYTDQDGNAGATTGAQGIGGAPAIGRCWQLPFAAGDCGVRKIESILGSVATAGTFNVRVLRPLRTYRVPSPGAGDLVKWIDAQKTRFSDLPALYVMVQTDLTSSGVPDLRIEMCDG